MKTVEESLQRMVIPERLDGQNQYYCGECERKADAFKGVKVRKYPPMLLLSLNRFEFNYETMLRVKINDKFAFGLELDVSQFAEKSDAFATEDEKIYELFGVFVHAGTALAGHHRIYLHDILK